MLQGFFAFIGLLSAFTPVDPPNLAYSTYLPGPAVAHTAVDKGGSQYFTLESTSDCADSPVYVVDRPVRSVFVGRLEGEAHGVSWITCLPGTSGGLAIDRSGALYVATNASEATTVTKFAPDTLRQFYKTTLGFASTAAVSLDGSGNVYMTGAATTGLRTTTGAYSSACASSTCGFVARLDPSGAAGFVTYLRANGGAIAVDSRGQAWITGHTSVSLGGDRRYSFAFVTKLNHEGSGILFDTGFGGGVVFGVPVSGSGLGISIDSEDAAYAVGIGAVSVPTTPGSLQPSNSSPYASLGYLVKFDATGKVVYGTYLKGRAQSVAVDESGNAYVAVWGQDRPANTNNAACGWGSSSTLFAINRDGSQVLSSRLVGGWVLALTRHGSGAAYMTGYTTSTAFVATPEAFQSEFARLFQSAFAAEVDFSRLATPEVTCVVNAATEWAGRNASGFNGAVAPGEVVTVYGGEFDVTGEVSVMFDDVPAPVLYASVHQINAVVPFRTGRNGGYTQLSIRLRSRVLGPYRLPLSQAVPGIFGDPASGPSQVAALNQDGSVNSITNPAAPGTVVTIYVTGAGLYDRELADGQRGPMDAPFAVPLLAARASMWSTSWPTIDAPVLFVGQAPGLVAGVVQMNLRIPEGLSPGRASLLVYFGDFSSPYQGSSLVVGSLK